MGNVRSCARSRGWSWRGRFQGHAAYSNGHGQRPGSETGGTAIDLSGLRGALWRAFLVVRQYKWGSQFLLGVACATNTSSRGCICGYHNGCVVVLCQVTVSASTSSDGQIATHIVANITYHFRLAVSHSI